MKKTKSTGLILSTNLFPVVGIGASAGGLDAFKKLIKAIQDDSGMAYVLVQHLDPKHESMLPEILQKVTKIPVLEISDDIKVLPNHIYILPSNKMLIANDGVLELSPRVTKKNERNLPIDLFFKSLAEVHQAHAIGVVLSGTASDGTLGLKAIKDHGGLTFAQDEESAAYESMPKSAMMAGVVDFVLPPEQIPQKLLEIKANIYNNDDDAQRGLSENHDLVQQILTLLRIRKGTDFTYYKQSTIRRRIFRRMAILKIDGHAEYLTLLRDNKSEQDLLFQDLLIPVTSFFRDHKNFDNLCESVFPQLVKNKTANEPIRVWVAGCSTGQEAYSIAICLKEFLGYQSVPGITRKVQIFATDISEIAIDKARSGIYSKVEIEGLNPQRLEEFFIKVNGDYQVIKQVREMCVFAIQNFIKDPPFGKMDFISCRNVLIYMEPYLQKKALTTFHYALNPKGFLWLGKSESIISVSDLFGSTGNADKIFSRKDAPGRFMHTASRRSEQNFQELNSERKNEKARADFQKVADDLLLTKYTPAAVVVNESMDIVDFRGMTNNYLEQSSGQPSHNLLKMAKDGLAFELRNLLHKVKKEKARVIKDNIPIQVDGQIRTITIEALPLPDTIDNHYLILFHDNFVGGNQLTGTGKIHDKETPHFSGSEENKDSRIRLLEQELAQSREDMRFITEDQEAVNEELQSANEELISGSEELQTLNEELETSKEELQSTNEELLIINQEMISLNEQITLAKEYSEAIVGSIRTPLLVLDSRLRIKSANNSFYKTFLVNEAETEGRLIYDIGNKDWDIKGLRICLEQILPEQTKIIDYEVQHMFNSLGDRTMLLNAHEIKSIGDAEKSILLVIEDISERSQLNLKAKDRAFELEKLVEERTAELRLAYEAQERKNKELVNMNRELQSFTYISSHDLQEPLRKIQTFATHILEKEINTLSEKGKDYFKRMQDAANRMQVLIEDLLAFSRLSNVNRRFELTNLTEIVGDVKTELNEMVDAKHATIEVIETCELNIIPFQFRQLMQNLISNSLKFSSPDRKPHIIIKSSQSNGTGPGNDQLFQGKPYCHISVSDNGIGFHPQYAEQIFELFERLHQNEDYDGTGIGLSIVKKVVENHGGIIKATGKYGKSATFDIYIPIE